MIAGPLRVAPERGRRILRLGLPIVGGMASGTLLSLIDTAMVGVLGNAALAAVGIGAFASWTYLGFFAGLVIAVQALVSRRLGEGRESEAGASLHAALLLLVLTAPTSAAVLWWLTPDILAWLNDDPEVRAHATGYLRWLIAQSLFAGALNAATGFWNGLGLAGQCLPALVAMHIANVFFNWVLIFGHLGAPALGVEGAGLGTALASVFGCVLFAGLAWRHGRPFGVFRARPTRQEVSSVVRLAVWGGVQQVLDALALTLMYRVVGTLGTIPLAAYAVLINLVSLVGLPAFALGTAGATLVGQALGRADVEDAARWAMDVLIVGCACLALLGVPFWSMPDAILSIWIVDPVTLDAARTPMRILGAMIAVNGIGYMLAAMLNGAGDVRRVTRVNLATQWFWLLPLAWWVGPVLGGGLIGVWCVHQFGFRALQSLVYLYFWRQRAWARIRL